MLETEASSDLGSHQGFNMKEFCRVVKTCSACPEQYDVFFNGEQIAYIRLRWGVLTCDLGKTEIYRYTFEDDTKGFFDSDYEREIFINDILKTILKYLTSII